ncbi:hypothetical protein V6N13_020154 [Hibiscus sabdariffa]
MEVPHWEISETLPPPRLIMPEVFSLNITPLLCPQPMTDKEQPWADWMSKPRVEQWSFLLETMRTRFALSPNKINSCISYCNNIKTQSAK